MTDTDTMTNYDDMTKVYFSRGRNNRRKLLGTVVDMTNLTESNCLRPSMNVGKGN
jgi:ABC-type antimicrobial peptide transport system ATPase subunit